MHAEAPPLPRLPELYLEAGAALLMARRPADCMTLCEEVINMTSELLPEKLILEEPEEKCETETGALCPEGQDLDQDRLGMMLWAGAAHLLCGHCQTHLKDWKEAVTHYTRCERCNCLYFTVIQCSDCTICKPYPKIRQIRTPQMFYLNV